MTNAIGITKALNHFIGNKMVRQTALEVWSTVVLETPHDTGRAQGSWRLKANEGDPSTLPPGESSYPAPMIPVPEPNPDNKDIYLITNNLQYIVPLNEGHSQQAGKFFIESAIVRAIKKVSKQLG